MKRLEDQVEQKNMEREKTMVELAMLCDRMDKDHSGSLSLEEMLNGYAPLADTSFTICASS